MQVMRSRKERRAMNWKGSRKGEGKIFVKRVDTSLRKKREFTTFRNWPNELMMRHHEGDMLIKRRKDGTKTAPGGSFPHQERGS